jgi:hypothetical protein
MLDKVKNALRVKTAAFDDEIQDLIDACKADLRLVGVNVPEDKPGRSPYHAGDCPLRKGKLRIFRRQREIPRGL